MKTLAVGGLLLVLLIPSAFAGAQSSSKGKVLCVELRGDADTIRDVKYRATSKCKAGEQKVALPRGLRGPRGRQGPAGPPGPPDPPDRRELQDRRDPPALPHRRLSTPL